MTFLHPPRNSEPTGSRRVPRVLAGTSLVFLLLAVFLFSQWGRDGDPALAQLRTGVALMEADSVDAARRALRAATDSPDSVLAAAAYHNLALLALNRSLEAGGPDPRGSAQEAARLGRNALRLAPGSRPTAWNLELAQRRLTELSSRDSHLPPVVPKTPGEDADTEEREAPSPKRGRSPGSREASGDGEVEEGRGGSMSETEARRLLASFRLAERRESAAVVRALLMTRTGERITGNRGPPW
jgi:hypothetical protein